MDPHEIGTARCSSDTGVPYRACLSDGEAQLRARRAGAAPAPRAHHRPGSNALLLAAGPAQGPSLGLWLVPYALELRHPGPDAGEAKRGIQVSAETVRRWVYERLQVWEALVFADELDIRVHSDLW